MIVAFYIYNDTLQKTKITTYNTKETCSELSATTTTILSDYATFAPATSPITSESELAPFINIKDEHSPRHSNMFEGRG